MERLSWQSPKFSQIIISFIPTKKIVIDQHGMGSVEGLITRLGVPVSATLEVSIRYFGEDTQITIPTAITIYEERETKTN